MTKKNVQARLDSYITGLPYGRMVAVFALYTDNICIFEQNIHTRFTKYRKQGEWFMLPKKILSNFVNDFEHIKTTEVLSWNNAPVGTAYYNQHFVETLKRAELPHTSWTDFSDTSKKQKCVLY